MIEPYVLVELSNIYDQDSHENLDLVGGEAITLTSIGGSMGFRRLIASIPPRIGNGGIQELDPRPSDDQCTLLADSDYDGT